MTLESGNQAHSPAGMDLETMRSSSHTSVVLTESKTTPGKGHQRMESGITLPVELAAEYSYPLNEGGRVNRQELMEILRSLKEERKGKAVYRGVACFVGLLLVCVLGINAGLTYVVVQAAKDTSVKGNLLVPNGDSRVVRQVGNFSGKLPVETSEAMVKFTVAQNKAYTPPSPTVLLSMKSVIYADGKGVHRHDVAGVTIRGNGATVYSTVPGIAFDFTTRGMYMYSLEEAAAGGTNVEEGPQPEQPGRKLLFSTNDCWTDIYEDEGYNENFEYTLETINVTECNLNDGLLTVVIYSVLNEAGDWEVESIDRWFNHDKGDQSFLKFDHFGGEALGKEEP